jgi:methionyl-tRNA synthetase
VSRSTALVERLAGGSVPAPAALEDADTSLAAEVTSLPGRVDEAVQRFALDDALGAVFAVVEAANRYVEGTAPWSLVDPGRSDRLRTVLYGLIETVAALGEELAPFLPATAQAIRGCFGPEAPSVRRAARWGLLAPGTSVRRTKALFPRRAPR